MKSPYDPERIKEIYDVIKPLYEEYSGYEIAEAHKIIRAEIERAREQAQILEEMAALEEKMASLRVDDAND